MVRVCEPIFYLINLSQSTRGERQLKPHFHRQNTKCRPTKSTSTVPFSKPATIAPGEAEGTLS
jgi:hypothetical protein